MRRISLRRPVTSVCSEGRASLSLPTSSCNSPTSADDAVLSRWPRTTSCGSDVEAAVSEGATGASASPRHGSMSSSEAAARKVLASEIEEPLVKTERWDFSVETSSTGCSIIASIMACSAPSLEPSCVQRTSKTKAAFQTGFVVLCSVAVVCTSEDLLPASSGDRGCVMTTQYGSEPKEPRWSMPTTPSAFTTETSSLPTSSAPGSAVGSGCQLYSNVSWPRTSRWAFW
mmetsp:Transcript_95250/g.238756  ORF Transcript_95250/g.238756 Transcript_95250/m.238756 type:complete len:229 (-) Transcript_95250:451-1137(-)